MITAQIIAILIAAFGWLASVIGFFYYNFCGFGRSLVNTYESSGLNMTNYFQIYGHGFVNHYHLSLKVGNYGLHLFSLLYFGRYLLKCRTFDDIESLDSVFNHFTKKQITQTKRLVFCYILFILSNLLAFMFLD